MNEISIKFGDDSIRLNLDGSWTPSTDNLTPLAKIAVTLSRPPFYEYSPADGAFGPRLAELVQSKIGGELDIPELDPSEPDPDIVF